jgi:ribonuclease P protein component
VVLHWLPVDGGGASHVGFVVSRAVGPATVRNRVRRQLRHLVRDRLPLVEPATQVVVRATPESATSSFDELGQALDTALSRARRRPVGPGAGAPAADRSC